MTAPGCSWCPPRCKSCTEDRDCECYTHQDEPDRHAADLDAIRQAVYAGDSTRDPEKDVRLLLAEIAWLHEGIAALADYWARRSYVVCANCGSHSDELRALLNPTAPTVIASGKGDQ